MANRVWLILFTMVLVLGLNRRSCVMGWALLPVHYTFNIENALSDDALDVHCSSNTKEGDLGIEHVPLHGNYVHRFKTGLVTTVSYGCTLTIPRDRVFKVVQVFTDAQKFVDEQCGGRHCFWKVQDDGIYLYQIHRGQSVKMYSWDHV